MARVAVARCTSGKAAGERACNEKLEARMIQSAQLEYNDLSTVIFRKTIPVLLCPRCDRPDHGSTPPPPQAAT